MVGYHRRQRLKQRVTLSLSLIPGGIEQRNLGKLPSLSTHWAIKWLDSICPLHILIGRDTFINFPTGFRKRLIFELASLCFDSQRGIALGSSKVLMYCLSFCWWRFWCRSALDTTHNSRVCSDAKAICFLSFSIAMLTDFSLQFNGALWFQSCIWSLSQQVWLYGPGCHQSCCFMKIKY